MKKTLLITTLILLLSTPVFSADNLKALKKELQMAKEVYIIHAANAKMALDELLKLNSLVMRKESEAKSKVEKGDKSTD